MSRDFRSLRPDSERFLLLAPKETPQTPKAANGRWYLRCAPHCRKPFRKPGRRQMPPGAAWLRFARAADGIMIGSAASASEAMHGRPSCAWMQRSAPHQRMTSVSGARSAIDSRRSLVFGQDQRNGVACGSRRGPPLLCLLTAAWPAAVRWLAYFMPAW